jgi:uncharacterized protein with PIN domain
MSGDTTSEPRFAADAMLGSLARWLRLLGYDCTYARDVKDGELVASSSEEGRIVLTRDRRVAKDSLRAIFVAPGTLDDELTAVLRALSILPPEEPPAVRCSLCNALLVAETAPAPPAVPARVVELRLDVWRCPTCGRHYWRGTHVESMAKRLREVRARLAPP